MNLGCARGVPVRLTRTEVAMLVCGSNMVGVVGVVMVSFFFDVSNGESNPLKWAQFLSVVLVWLFG